MRTSSLNRPVASFNSGGVVDCFSGRQGEGGENAEVVDDMSPAQGLEDASHKLFGGVGGYESKATSLVNFGQNVNRRSFSGAWKPVIDGRIQLPDESPGVAAGGADWTNEQGRSSGGGGGTTSASGSLSKRLHYHGSASEMPSVSNISGSSDIKKDDEGNDSDSDSRRVPELPEKCLKGGSRPQKSGVSTSRKRGGASSTDKEGKRLKRLLRNRVSAQQARERKKAYLVELERKAKDLETRNAELEEKNATLQRENFMLRQIVKNTTMRGGGGDLANS